MVHINAKLCVCAKMTFFSVSQSHRCSCGLGKRSSGAQCLNIAKNIMSLNISTVNHSFSAIFKHCVKKDGKLILFNLNDV